MSPTTFALLSALAMVVFVGLDLRSADMRAGFVDPKRRARNIGYIVGNIIAMITLNAVNLWLSAHLVPLVSWQAWPLFAEVAACVFVAEGINWLSHWVKHTSPWLWTFHLQHHVSRHYDSTLTLHTHGVDVVVSGAAMSAVLVWSGFSKFSVDVFLLLYFATNLYKHGHSRLSLGRVLDAIIVSPAYHRLHHSPTARGNYGSVLTVFDVLLGTAVWPGDDIFDAPVGVADVDEAPFIDELLLPITARRPATPRAD
jgi:sterol desaturase/sphingolipid hydroxylase (fatty acid hydroxylase superfamily)